jgi:hypothetical protein
MVKFVVLYRKKTPSARVTLSLLDCLDVMKHGMKKYDPVRHIGLLFAPVGQFLDLDLIHECLFSLDLTKRPLIVVVVTSHPIAEWNDVSGVSRACVSLYKDHFRRVMMRPKWQDFLSLVSELRHQHARRFTISL